MLGNDQKPPLITNFLNTHHLPVWGDVEAGGQEGAEGEDVGGSGRQEVDGNFRLRRRLRVGLGTSRLETSLGGRLELSCMRAPTLTPVFETSERFPCSSQFTNWQWVSSHLDTQRLEPACLVPRPIYNNIKITASEVIRASFRVVERKW